MRLRHPTIARGYVDRRQRIGHEEHLPDRAVKRHFLAQSKRSLKSCAKVFKPVLVRDTDTVLNTSHHSNLADITVNSDSSEYFGSNHTCILSPEGEIGPFWAKGELTCEDIVDDEPGVNCNFTGVYSGVQDDSNGNGDDASNLNKTALRGIQATDEDGVAQLRSIFQATILAALPTPTLWDILERLFRRMAPLLVAMSPTLASYFTTRDLITSVEATYPCNTSTVDITLNSTDRVFGLETEDSNSDPILEYVLLGDNVSDGVFSWITIGVDLTATYETSYAALLTTSGGVSSSSSCSVGTNGTGSAPSGSAAPSAVAASCGSPKKI
ncbi:gpi anchored dioxygenase [Seiridium cupressi]